MSFNSYVDWEGNTTSLTYDKLMRVTNVTRSAISSSGNQNYAVQTYTYNNGSQITTNEFGTSNKPADFASAVYAYNPDGQLVLIRLSNNIYTLYHYSDDGSLTKIEHMHDADADGITYNETTNQFDDNDGTPLSRLSYSYDDNGQMISRARQFFDSNGNHQRTAWREFTYDNLGRLVGESYEQNDVSDLSKNQIRLYNYDLAGNRASMRSQAGITSYTYDELHQLTDDGSSTYQYDLVGSLIAQNSSTNRSLTYDVAGNLVQVINGGNTINYTYDDSGSGHLQTRTFNGTTTTYFWEGYSLSLEKENGSAVRAYFNHPWEVGSTICRFDLGDGLINSNDDAWFYLHDEAGNVILITDKDGNPIIEYEQDVWGNDLAGNFGDFPYITQHQTGKLWDAEAGLYYNSARWYDPVAGRFISVSPISPFAEEEYAFCHNNPVNFVDVNGAEPITITALAGAAATGAAAGAVGGGIFYLGEVAFTSTEFSWDGLGSSAGIGAVYGAALGPIGKVAAPYISPYASKIPFLGRLFAGGVDDAAKHAVKPNKLHHIFGKPEHKLDCLVSLYGSEAAAFNAIENAIIKKVNEKGINGLFEIVVNVSGQDVTVRGNVIEGVVKIGTAFIP